MLPPDAVAALVARHKAQQATIIDRTSAKVTRAWAELGSWDLADVERFLAEVAPAIDAAHIATTRLGNAFYTTVLQIPGRPVDPPATVYGGRAAFEAMWHALAEKRGFDQAVATGQSAAQAQVANFVASTARQVGGHVAKQSGRRITGWERVPSPTACDWCQTVAGQIYHSADSADFGHDRCDCTAVPVAA